MKMTSKVSLESLIREKIDKMKARQMLEKATYHEVRCQGNVQSRADEDAWQ
jgi:hypothetical protein